MNRIDAMFSRLRSEGRKGLAPFLCGGYPSIDATERALVGMDRAGACMVEIGIPFSDPIADGPVIAAAMHEALERGVTPTDVFGAIARARKSAQVPIVLMVSVSIVWRMGIEKMVGAARDAGVDGFILPDAPVEEAQELTGPIRAAGMTASLLVAPTTPEPRMAKIVAACSGFVYLLARVGITGDNGSGAKGPGVAGAAIGERVRLIRRMTDLPIACGFGISTPDDVATVVREGGADAAIVGSALVRRMGKAVGGGFDGSGEAESFTRSLAIGLR